MLSLRSPFRALANQSGASDYSAPLWTLLMFEAFLRNVVDDASAPAIGDMRASVALA